MVLQYGLTKFKQAFDAHHKTVILNLLTDLFSSLSSSLENQWSGLGLALMASKSTFLALANGFGQKITDLGL